MQTYKNKANSKPNNAIELTQGKTVVSLKISPSKKKHTTQKPVRRTCFATQLTGFYVLRVLTRKRFQVDHKYFLAPF